jgi:hypothetical protein
MNSTTCKNLKGKKRSRPLFRHFVSGIGPKRSLLAIGIEEAKKESFFFENFLLRPNVTK